MERITRSDSSLRYWLYVCAALVGLMIILGGVTRLTGSGLSMVKWQPFTILPPMNYMEWQEVFAAYKQSPEFLKVNHYFDLASFKKIFWLEYLHRLLGRIIGVVFLLPYMIFLFSKKISKSLALPLFGIFVLGCIQGVVGWYMVKSGLMDDPNVSHYRLVLHLLIGFFIFSLLIIATIDKSTQKLNVTGNIYFLAWSLWVVIIIQVITGAFVAGLDAGLIHNDFPKMSGKWLSDDIGTLTPHWRNFFDNPAQVQFEHRVVAFIILVLAMGLYLSIRRASAQNLCYLSKAAIRTAVTTLWLIIGQIILGITTLLYLVPIPLASLHQVFALLIFTTSSVFLYKLYN